MTYEDKLADYFDGFDIWRNEKRKLYYIRLNASVEGGKFEYPVNDKNLTSLKLKIRELRRKHSFLREHLPALTAEDILDLDAAKAELMRLDKTNKIEEYNESRRRHQKMCMDMGVSTVI